MGSAGTDLDAIAAAFAALRVGASHTDPDVVVMHPTDCGTRPGLVLAKESGGAYLLGDPVSAVKPSLWGVPVVLSESMTENTALVANLKPAATAYVRQPPTVEVAPYEAEQPSSSPTRPLSGLRLGWRWRSTTRPRSAW